MGAFQRRIGAIIEGEDAMATLAVQLTIGDYAKWRPVFDKHKPLRDKAVVVNIARVACEASLTAQRRSGLAQQQTGDGEENRRSL